MNQRASPRESEDALGVHPVQDVVKPLALDADQALRRDLDVVEEQRVRRVVHHHPERPHLEPLEVADVDQED